ncbi:MAG: EAL domain-containing protein [Lachnospiraceae bacterium]|nr:EAL domain-containing protein [Lachnospiraceae bacterium]
MLKSHVKFNSVSGKRLILIVDDERVNREILGQITAADFEPLYAANGLEAMEIIREKQEYLSLVLLDLLMPEMDGYEVIRKMRSDTVLSGIPIIVLTSEESAEVECLRLGASDFIVKPFSMPEVILARIQRTIELFEDRHIIQSTERDALTGLFNRDFFYRYAEQYDHFHADQEMDALALDICHFHMINELHGKETGDEVLQHLSAFIKGVITETGGMACRLQGDKFQLYLPHADREYEEMLIQMNEHFSNYKEFHIRVRGGLYAKADKSIDIERRFDRAVLASNSIRRDYSRVVGYYDPKRFERELYAGRLIRDIDEALEQEQFQIYYQPKYNVTGDMPVLSSAEALIRWQHPEFGMVNPAIFVPLFEKNGLIQKLDYYILRKVGAQIRRCRDKLGITVPVSVNVSRVDLYERSILDHLEQILTENALTTEDLFLEITESAYAEKGEQIVAMVEELRRRGYKIEMDDFGTGYSSLNMLADIPVDILKMDMKFVQNLSSSKKRERLVRLIIDIADYLNVEVIAEGVEDTYQLEFLKKCGCGIIQGYYFSKPLPEEAFLELVGKELLTRGVK